MTEKLDSLGRRIPTFDRSAAAKKGAETRKENHGNDIHKRTGRAGGARRSRGYFGRLKDEGKTEELRRITDAGRKKATPHFAKLKKENRLDELKEIQLRSAEARKANRSGKDSAGKVNSRG